MLSAWVWVLVSISANPRHMPQSPWHVRACQGAIKLVHARDGGSRGARYGRMAKAEAVSVSAPLPGGICT